MNARLISVLGILMVLSACQHRISSEEPSTAVWRTDQALPRSEQQQAIMLLNHWNYKAKVGVRSDTFSEQASLNWQFGKDKQQLKLYGPFGAGAVTLNVDASGAELTDKNGQLHTGYSAEHLLFKLLGWPLPVEALSSWIFAMPADAPYQYRLDERQNLSELKQLGWHIQYKNYAEYQGYYLPRLLIAKKVFEQSELGEMTVKVAAKRFFDADKSNKHDATDH